MKLNKKYVLDRLEEQFVGKYTKTELRDILDTLLEIVASVFRKNHRLTIAPLGTFYNRVRKARTMKHPSTGETVEVKEALIPAYKPSTTIKRVANN